MSDPELPVTRGDQWEEISFEEVGGVENVPRAIVEVALRTSVEDAARRERARALRQQARFAIRDRNVRLARDRSIAARRALLQVHFRKHFRKVDAGSLRRVRRYIKKFEPDQGEIRARFPSRHGEAFDQYCAIYAGWLCQDGLHWYYD